MWRARLQRALVFAELARMHRPVGTALCVLPSWFAAAMCAAPGTLPPAASLATYLAGGLLLRGAGCAINDAWDHRIDARVRRTAGRPVAAGRVTPREAFVFAGAQAVAASPLLLALNGTAQAVAVASLLPSALYPLAKRVTRYPQAALALTFNAGAPVAWAAATGGLAWPCAALYVACASWTMLYDTQYAHQDRRDDLKVGIGSTAVTFGDADSAAAKRPLYAFAAITVGGLAVAAAQLPPAPLAWPFWAALATGGALIVRRIATIDLADERQCAAAFKEHVLFGAIIFVGIVGGKLLLVAVTRGDDDDDDKDKRSVDRGGIAVVDGGKARRLQQQQQHQQ